MKKHLYLTFFLIYSTSQAQNVGINTDSPQRSLDVNGNAKVTTLTNVSNNVDYPDLLIADKNNGNVDKIPIPALELKDDEQVEIKRTIYLGTTSVETKDCSCGDITFRLNNANTPQIKLNSTQPFTKINAKAFSFGYGVKSWLDQSYSYYDRKGTNNLSFSTSDFTTYKNLDATNFGTNANNVRIFTIILPGQNNLYRLTISRLKNTSTTDIFSLICEKFYVPSI